MSSSQYRCFVGTALNPVKKWSVRLFPSVKSEVRWAHRGSCEGLTEAEHILVYLGVWNLLSDLADYAKISGFPGCCCFFFFFLQKKPFVSLKITFKLHWSKKNRILRNADILMRQPSKMYLFCEKHKLIKINVHLKLNDKKARRLIFVIKTWFIEQRLIANCILHQNLLCNKTYWWERDLKITWSKDDPLQIMF